jgi:uncharacterized protein YqeY
MPPSSEPPPIDPSASRAAADLIGRLEADLRVARKAGDRSATTALRTALAAIANAEAPAVVAPDGPADAPTVGRLVDHTRLALSGDDILALIRHEIDDRHDTIAQIEPYGRTTEADALRAEIAVLHQYVG